ncbi:sulfite exporter TauE/SafE family protein [Prosthecochloris sp. N3]|uniref:Probable membrane transporter protein n=1 Tax=Prosthecochloris ethylica TaxID=2743976 RepID=A0ABR9XU99_9CHLB|nr:MULTISPECIES: sulfite exporter TauE/SafE family protein [Prosthecochloris]MEC9486225.1 sulfite exporter TauE/SafE family protein [Prosthecochloris sp.]MBF0587368.1 sulfite exporter TauE/SafE family protein [Prosthecochloris ethylica]MBF0637593.1 sulfite exporter TauE/SafE family protein [Prosthecochloris ethylica]NUK48495.1 sulfite exporter TauE/SafE family protein [Prosthecochloris ethylica]RNA65339.1 sulfite exporter TauE/SafE family protein [Prosthecochloris sp. ZM_2]
MQYLWMILTGMAAGVLSGMFGIGGGVIIVPALVLVLGFTQHAANATSLVALLLPVGLLGVLEYYRAGKIGTDNIWFGLLIALGVFFGAYFGAKIAGGLSSEVLRKLFAVFLGIVAVRLWLQ